MGEVHNRMGDVRAGFVVQADSVGDISVPGPAPARSRYREQVREIAPPLLVGREPELALLAEFASGETRYLWVRAPKWAGKSALLSWFVLHPPVGVRVVSFFITARLADSDHRGAFADVVLEQLADLLDEPLPPHLTDATRESHLRGLLADAAALCRSRGERLLLVVDGLDEDRGAGPSIASLLPARPPEGLHVLVSGRPHPPIPADVRADHPLRDPSIVVPLVTSPAALVIRDDMELELARILDGPPEVQDLLGLVTAAAGGLSAEDLAELTATTAAEVRRILRRTATRTFDVRPSRWQPGVRPEVYLLGHEELQLAAIDHIGPTRLRDYRARLHTWAESYRARGWPDDTPEYLLRGYFRMVAAHGGPLLELCTDARRHDRMAEVAGGDAPALSEIAVAETRLAGTDLPTAARLAVHRDRLTRRGGHLPTTLLTVWGALGHTARAEVMLGVFRDPDRRAAAQIALVAAVADTGDLDRAAAIAATAVEPEARAAALSRLAAAHARAGEPERARALIAEAAEVMALIIERGKLGIAAAAQIDALVAVGDVDAARALPGRLSEAIRDELLSGLVRALGPGHAEEAERITDPGVRAGALTAIAVDRAGFKAAMRALRGVRGEIERAVRRVALVPAAVAAGDPARARSLALAAGPGWRAQGLAALAGALGNTEQAAAVRGEAEAAARAIPSEYWKANALIDVAVVEARAGQVDRALAILDSITLPDRRVRGLGEVALGLAAAGRAADALRLATAAEVAAREIAAARPRVAPLVSALLGVGDFDRACAVVDAIDCDVAVIEDLVLALASDGQLERAERIAHHSVDSDVWPGDNVPDWALPMVADYRPLLPARGVSGRVRSEVVRGWVVAGHLDEADAAVGRLFSGDKSSGEARLARDLAAAGHCDRAEAMALRLRPQDAVDVVRVLATQGDFDRAERLARALPTSAETGGEPGDDERDNPRTQALGHVQVQLRAAGLTERADRITAEVDHFPRGDLGDDSFAWPRLPRPEHIPDPDAVRRGLADGQWRDVVAGLPVDALEALADEVLALPR